jgi:hypothetical protein
MWKTSAKLKNRLNTFEHYDMLLKTSNSTLGWACSITPAAKPSHLCLEAELERIMVQDQPGKNLARPPSQQISRAWSPVPVIPAAQEATGRSATSEAGPEQKVRLSEKTA